MVASKIKAAGIYPEGSGSDPGSGTIAKNTEAATPKSVVVALNQRHYHPHTYLDKTDISGAQIVVRSTSKVPLR